MEQDADEERAARENAEGPAGGAGRARAVEIGIKQEQAVEVEKTVAVDQRVAHEHLASAASAQPAPAADAAAPQLDPIGTPEGPAPSVRAIRRQPG
jgi:hypothetical protein